MGQSGLKSPPSPDEGEFPSVAFECVYPLDHFSVAFQACGDEVDRNVPHTKALVWINTPPVMQAAKQLKELYFCDRECWTSSAE